MKIHYPSAEQIVEFNRMVLVLVKVRKADATKVLSYHKIVEAIDECKLQEGDLYDKAIVLLRALVKKHPFASGNRRTAFVVMADFLAHNNTALGIKNDPSQARVLQGIREDFYTSEEIKEWIKHGKIKPFKRH